MSDDAPRGQRPIPRIGIAETAATFVPGFASMFHWKKYTCIMSVYIIFSERHSTAELFAFR
jgi:hypothetical protein